MLVVQQIDHLAAVPSTDTRSCKVTLHWQASTPRFMEITEPKATIHLIVLQHGLWGHSGDVAKLTDFLRNAFQVQGQEPDEIVLLNSEVNSRRLTYDGIDVCGARLAQLVQDTIQQYADHGRKVVKLSLIGYSLGGVIVRFAAGRLYVAGVFEELQPCNLITIATPHLGSFREPTSYFARFFNSQVPIIASRTGRQLMLVDADYTVPWLTQQQEMHNKVHKEHEAAAQQQQQHQQQQLNEQATETSEQDIVTISCATVASTKEKAGSHQQQQQQQGGVILPSGVDPSKPVPLLLLMAHPAGPFWRALRRFNTRMCAANIRYDTMVPYCTAALCVSNPYESAQPMSLNPDKYPSVVRPATNEEQQQQAATVRLKGRSRLFFLFVFLPLFPFFWAYTASFGILHHWKAKRRPLDSNWLQQYVAEHHIFPSKQLGKQPSKQLQQQQPVQQARAAADLREVEAVEAAVAVDQATAAAAAAAAADQGDMSPTSSSLLPAGTVLTAPDNSPAHQLSPFHTAAADSTCSDMPAPASASSAAASEGADVQASILEQALSSEGIVVHEGIAEQPWALHEVQQWMAQKLFDEMTPCWVPERMTPPSSSMTATSSSSGSDGGVGMRTAQPAAVVEAEGITQTGALVMAEAPAAVGSAGATDSACSQQHTSCAGSSSSSIVPGRSSNSEGGQVSGFRSSGGWHRVDVWRGHLHAHAAIIIRDNRFEAENRDFFQYIADHMTL